MFACCLMIKPKLYLLYACIKLSLCIKSHLSLCLAHRSLVRLLAVHVGFMGLKVVFRSVPSVLAVQTFDEKPVLMPAPVENNERVELDQKSYRQERQPRDLTLR